MVASEFRFDPTEQFPRLSRPPIVEAVIHWQAKANWVLSREELTTALEERFPHYPQREPLQRVELLAQLAEPGTDPVVQQSSGWQGVRLRSKDGHVIVQFLRDGLVFSRTREYENWESFSAAAEAAWKVFVDLARPVEIQRLGVRFINHLAEATSSTLGDWLKEQPTRPLGLPPQELLYRSTFAVPGQPLAVRVIKALQPSVPGLQDSRGLFLDIDVFSTKSVAVESGEVRTMLEKMRWLKNKVFFTLLTEKATNSYLKAD